MRRVLSSRLERYRSCRLFIIVIGEMKESFLGLRINMCKSRINLGNSQQAAEERHEEEHQVK